MKNPAPQAPLQGCEFSDAKSTPSFDPDNEALAMKFSQLCDLIEKCHIPDVSDKMQSVYDEMSVMNHQMRESMALLMKETTIFKKINEPQPQSSSPRNNFGEELAKRDKEIASLKDDRATLREAIDNTFKENAFLLKEKLGLLERNNDLNLQNQRLHTRISELEGGVLEAQSARESVAEMSSEITRLKAEAANASTTIAQLQSDLTGKEYALRLLESERTQVHETITNAIQQRTRRTNTRPVSKDDEERETAPPVGPIGHFENTRSASSKIKIWRP